MKVLYLDLDGPMFSDRVIAYHKDNHYRNDTLCYLQDIFAQNGDTFGAKCLSYWRMDEVAVGMLNKLMDAHPFETVLSSTWRELFTKESIEHLFSVNALNLKFHKNWCTPLKTHGMYDSGYSSRNSEITQHIDAHNIQNYAILDDPSSGVDLDKHRDKSKVVMVNPFIGMECKHFQQLKKLLED